MNRFEREVARSQLMGEREALEQLKKIYSDAVRSVCEKLEISNGKIIVLLKEIENADEKTLSVLQSQIYQRNFQKNIKNQLDFLLKDLNDSQYAGISEYLRNSYDNGFIGTLYSLNMSGAPLFVPIDPTLVVRAMYVDSKLSKKLYDRLGEDVEQLKKKVSATISRGIASNMHYNDIARNIANNSKTGLNRAMTITRTEGNRIYNAAALDSGKAAREKGVDNVKQWDSTLDGNTRPNHRKLDGQVRELEEDFEVNGRKAPAPLQFGRPEEDINCRCMALIKPRWDVDEAFTKIDNESGQLLEFEGTKDYEDFKKRYWEKTEKEQNNKKTTDKTSENNNKSDSGQKKAENKFYTKSELEKMSLSELRNNTKSLAEKYYKSGKSGISFGDTNVTQAAEKLTANASRTALTKDYMSMKKKLESIDNSENGGIIKVTKNAVGKEVIVVNETKVNGKPNSITQKVSAKGGVERNYYDENGRQFKQISNNHHGKPKAHPYGRNGEHAHDYIYNDDGKLIDRPTRELTDEERKENSDVL